MRKKLIHPLLQLATGGIDISATGIADGGLDADASKRVEEVLSLALGRRLELRAGDLVQLNKIHVGQRVAAEVAESVHLVARVVHAADEGVLIGRSAAGAVDVLAHGSVKVEQRVLLDARHQEIARLLHRGVERNREGELLGLMRELADHRDDAASRDGQVACADPALLGVVELAERG